MWRRDHGIVRDVARKAPGPKKLWSRRLSSSVTWGRGLLLCPFPEVPPNAGLVRHVLHTGDAVAVRVHANRLEQRQAVSQIILSICATRPSCLLLSVVTISSSISLSAAGSLNWLKLESLPDLKICGTPDTPTPQLLQPKMVAS